MSPVSPADALRSPCFSRIHRRIALISERDRSATCIRSVWLYYRLGTSAGSTSKHPFPEIWYYANCCLPKPRSSGHLSRFDSAICYFPLPHGIPVTSHSLKPDITEVTL
jgi:hypothetical protein